MACEGKDAMSWIKIRTNLATNPKVVNVAALTGKHVCFVLGALQWLWALADEHTTDGVLSGYTPAVIDRATGIRGFCDALQKLKPDPWLIVHDDGRVQIAKFDEHNGTSAKKRAQEQAKKAGQRSLGNGDRCPDVVPAERGHVSPPRGDQIREDKRREEETPQPPSGADGCFPGFVRFWDEWPKHSRKCERERCKKKWHKLGLELLADVVIDGLRRWKQSAEWTKENGQFIPAPHPWLNKRRWEQAGALVPAAQGGGFPEISDAETLRILQAEGLTP